TNRQAEADHVRGPPPYSLECHGLVAALLAPQPEFLLSGKIRAAKQDSIAVGYMLAILPARDDKDIVAAPLDFCLAHDRRARPLGNDVNRLVRAAIGDRLE